jgi:hypothetical protein
VLARAKAKRLGKSVNILFFNFNLAAPTYTSDPLTSTTAGTYNWTAQVASSTTGVESTAEIGGSVAAEQSLVSKAPSTISTAQSWVPDDTVTPNHGGSVSFTLLKDVGLDTCKNNTYTSSDPAVVYDPVLVALTETAPPMELRSLTPTQADTPRQGSCQATLPELRCS